MQQTPAVKGTRWSSIGLILKDTRWSRDGPVLKFVRLIWLTKEYVIRLFWSSFIKLRGILTLQSHKYSIKKQRPCLWGGGGVIVYLLQQGLCLDLRIGVTLSLK